MEDNEETGKIISPNTTLINNNNNNSVNSSNTNINMTNGSPVENDKTETEGLIEEEITCNVGGRRIVRGKAFKNANGDYVCYTSIQGVEYTPGACVYIDSQRPEQPYFICTIQEFRRSKRDTLLVTVKWYYRPSEVPESVYQLLVQDRNTENRTGKDLIIKDSVTKGRELFISDASDTYPVSALRGRCRVHHFIDIFAAKDFQPRLDSFFYILGYNPETRRLASTQGEIRVGPSHQSLESKLEPFNCQPSLYQILCPEARARVPDYRPNIKPHDMLDRCEPVEELLWAPGIADCDLMMYLTAARSMAAFAGMCDGGSADDGYLAASRDDTTINAMDLLHQSCYDTGKALKALVKNPVPQGIDKKWNDDETKRFVKGLRQYGKNFFKIRKELLPHKETCDLVEFYYLWKKTPAAANSRPHRRHRRQSVLSRRIRNGARSSRPASSEYHGKTSSPTDSLKYSGFTNIGTVDLSSASEEENDSDDSDSRDLSSYACRHCYTTSSKDWHHAGKDKVLLCTECRIFFKKYGEPRPIDAPKEPPPFMFKPVVEDENFVNGKHSMRTRRNKDNNQTHRGCSKQRQNVSSPDNEDSSLNSSIQPNSKGRKSPSTVSTCSNSSSDKREKGLKKNEKARDSPVKAKKRNAEKNEQDDKIISPSKKKSQERSETPDFTSESDSGSNEENGHDGDNEQEGLSSSPSPAVPSPSETSENDLDKNKNNTNKPLQNSSNIEDSKLSMDKLCIPEIKSEQINNYNIKEEIYEFSTNSPDNSTLSLSNNNNIDNSEMCSNIEEDLTQPISHPMPPVPQSTLTPTIIPPPPPLLHSGSPMPPLPPLIPASHIPPISTVVTTSITSTITTTISTTPCILSPSLINTAPPLKPQPSGPFLDFGPPPSPFVKPFFSPCRSPKQSLTPPLPPLSLSQAYSPKLEDLPPSSIVSPSIVSPLSLASVPIPLSTPGILLPTEEEEEEEEMVENRGPSPEPRLDDTVCHRSASAMFIRHWNRGEGNCCSRTDLLFKPPPDSKLAKKREEEQRKQVEIKEEKLNQKTRTPSSTPESRNNDAKISGPFSAYHPPNFYESRAPRPYPSHDTPALRQLSEYARPHTDFSPNIQRTAPQGMPLPPHGIDPMLHYQLSSGLYAHGARERLELELEREKRERELRERELRERELHDKMKAELEMKHAGLDRIQPGASPIDSHWLELHRRYSNLAPGVAGVHQSPFAFYPQGNSLLERERLERVNVQSGMPTFSGESAYSSSVERLSAERLHAERMALATDPMMRLQMGGVGGVNPHAHTHTHSHSHTHLHLHPDGNPHPLGPIPHPHMTHPGQEIPAEHSLSGVHPLIPGGPFPRPQYLGRGPEMINHPGLLGRPYEDALAHQLSAQVHHEQLQRQMLIERERYQQQAIQQQILAQHDEFFRQQQQQQQRDREMKLRTLEEAARGRRPLSDPHKHSFPDLSTDKH